MRNWKTASALLVFLAGGLVISLVVLGDPEDALPVAASNSSDNDDSPNAESDTSGSEETPDRIADSKMQNLDDAQKRLDHLDWVSEQDWAKSDNAIFRRTIVSDPSEEVQIHAVDKAFELAKKEGSGATTKVVKFALASNKGNTRARGLKAAKNNPDATLVAELIALVDNEDRYAPMALNALTYTDSDEAHAKVREVANNTEADSKLRQRAVALLGVFKDVHDKALLSDLMNGDDQTMRAIASEVMRLIDKG
jgi:hypothetical protein